MNNNHEIKYDGEMKTRINNCLWAATWNSEITHVSAISRRGDIRLHGVQKCGMAAACPVCRDEIIEFRTGEIGKMMDWASLNEYFSIKVRMTAGYHRTDNIGILINMMNKAKKHLKETDVWLALHGKVVGTMTYPSVTFGLKGWHLSHDEIMFLSADNEEMAIKAVRELSKVWIKCLSKAGLHDDRASLIAGGENAAREFAENLMDDEELLDRPISDRDIFIERNPTQLLRDATNGDHEAADLWSMQVSGFEASPLMSWSPGFRKSAGIKELSDEMIVQVEAFDRSKDKLIAKVPKFDWSIYDHLRYEISDAVNSGDAKSVRKMLKSPKGPMCPCGCGVRMELQPAGSSDLFP
jgi:hypothetical protein